MKKVFICVFSAAILLSSTVILAGEKQSVEFLNSGAVLPADGKFPFSEAVRVGNTIYLSGQLGIVPETLKLIEGGIEAETRQTMTNIKSSLEAHGLSMNNVIKCTVMLADISEWPAFNAVYTTFFNAPFPARSAFATNGLALGARTEVECIAVDF